MILRLQMPFVDQLVEWVRVLTWHKGEGQPVGYGDDLCDVAVEENRALMRVYEHRITELMDELVTSTSDGEAPPRYWTRTGFEYRLRLVSSDAGYLRSICAGTGSRVDIGQVLALLTTSGDDPLASDGTDPPARFRVVVNMLDAVEEG